MTTTNPDGGIFPGGGTLLNPGCRDCPTCEVEGCITLFFDYLGIAHPPFMRLTAVAHMSTFLILQVFRNGALVWSREYYLEPGEGPRDISALETSWYLGVGNYVAVATSNCGQTTASCRNLGRVLLCDLAPPGEDGACLTYNDFVSPPLPSAVVVSGGTGPLAGLNGTYNLPQPQPGDIGYGGMPAWGVPHWSGGSFSMECALFSIWYSCFSISASVSSIHTNWPGTCAWTAGYPYASAHSSAMRVIDVTGTRSIRNRTWVCPAVTCEEFPLVNATVAGAISLSSDTDLSGWPPESFPDQRPWPEHHAGQMSVSIIV